MPKKSPPIDEDRLAVLVSEMGQPIKMVAETLGITEYRVRKVIKDNEIKKSSESATDVIIGKAFTDRLEEREYLKQKAFAVRLFKVAPDIRFWKSFTFKKFSYTCLSYFTTGFLKKLEAQYEAFQQTMVSGSISGAMIILTKLYPDKDFTQSNNQGFVADASLMYTEIPDDDFWKSFDLLKAFPDYKLGSLKYFHMDFAKKEIRNHYNRFKFNPPTPEKVQLEENKIGDDAEVKSRTRSTIDFLNS